VGDVSLENLHQGALAATVTGKEPA